MFCVHLFYIIIAVYEMEKTERENEMDLKSRLLRICKNLAKNEHVSKFFRMFFCVASNHGAQKTVSLAGPSIQQASLAAKPFGGGMNRQHGLSISINFKMNGAERGNQQPNELCARVYFYAE